MCGLGITLGKSEPPVPEAARDFAKAIIDDLEAADSKKMGKRKAPHNESPEAAGMKEGTAKATGKNPGKKSVKNKVVKQVQSNIKVRKGKATLEKLPFLEEEDGAAECEIEVVGGGTLLDRQSDGIHADHDVADVDMQEVDPFFFCLHEVALHILFLLQSHSFKQEPVRPVHHDTESGKHEHEADTATHIWNERFQQLYKFTRNRLIQLCDVDIDGILDDKGLEDWNRTIDLADPHAAEILGHIVTLRSIFRLERGDTEILHDTLHTIGAENLKEKKQKQQDRTDRDVNEHDVGGQSGREEGDFAIEVEQVVVVGDDDMKDTREVEDEEEDLGMDGAALGMVMGERHASMKEGGKESMEVECEPRNQRPDEDRNVMVTQSMPIGEVEKDSSGNEDDGISAPAVAVIKRKRGSSMGSTSSEVSMSIVLRMF